MIALIITLVLMTELVWLRSLERRATQLADRFVDAHVNDADAVELLHANWLAVAGAAACGITLLFLASRLPTLNGWFFCVALCVTIALLPTCTGLIRVAKRLKEVGRQRGLQ